METERITSVQNARIKKLTRLHQKKERDETGLFLIEGEHLIQEALKAGIIEEILSDEDCPFDFERITPVTDNVMAKLSSSVSAVHYIAVCRQPQMTVHDARRILMLDDVQDPGNLGTLIRTAVSFRFDGICCSQKTVDLYNEKVIRSTQGALFAIPVICRDLLEAIADLHEQGFEVIGTSLQNAEAMTELKPTEKMAIVLGNEGSGVSAEVLNACDRCVRIEMNGFESLNVAVAGGILMYAYRS